MTASPLATRPKAADVKIMQPETTRNATRTRRGLSTVKRSFPILMCGEGKYDTHKRKNNREDPITHNYFVPRPPNSFEMVVQRRDQKKLLAKEAFPYHLKYVGENGGDKERIDNRQNSNSHSLSKRVGHKY